MENREVLILRDVFQKSRDMGRWYLSLLKEVDPYKQWQVNDVKLNSVLWLASHISWSENFLLLKGTGGQPLEVDWLENYNISSSGDLHHAEHNMKIVMATMKEVHEKAMAHLATLTDGQLLTENPLGIGFGGDKSIRMIIQHAIRHDSIHVGQLGWLCKINKVESV